MPAVDGSDWPVLATCLSKGRPAHPGELDQLAQRIWSETYPDTAWEEVKAGSDRHRMAMAVASIAVGLPACFEEAPESEAAAQVGTSGSDPGAAPESLSPDGLADADYIVLARFRQELRGFLRFSERAAEGFGITAQQYQALLALRAAPRRRLSVGALAAELELRPQSASGLLSRLEATGMVRRVRLTHDRRQVDLHLTAAGSDLLESLARAHRLQLGLMRPVLVALAGRLS